MRVLVVLLALATLAAPAAAQSPFDALDAAAIPKEERYAGQPKELVAILGSNRGRMWEPIFSLALSPNGKLLAAGGIEGGVKLWDAATLREVAAFRAHGNVVNAVAFSGDGQTLASASFNGSQSEIKLWEARTGKLRATFGAHTAPVRALVFSPDGSRLTSGAADGLVRVWDWVRSACAAEFRNNAEDVLTLAFAADGHVLVVIDGKGAVSWWDADTGKARAAPDGVRPAAGATFSADGRLLVTWKGSTVRVLDWKSDKTVARAELSHPWDVKRVLISPDGSRAAVVDDHAAVHVWDLTAAKPRRLGMLKDLTGAGRGAVLALGDTHLLAAIFWQHAVRQWDVRGAEVRELPLPPGPRQRLFAVEWSGDGGQVFGAEHGADGWVWDWHDRRFADGIAWYAPPGKRTGSMLSVESMALSPDGRTLATQAGPVVRLWDVTVRPPKLKSSLDNGLDPDLLLGPEHLAIAPHGAALACHTVGTWVSILDVGGAAPKERFQLQHRSVVSALAYSPDGKTLAVGGYKGAVWLYDAASGQERWSAETTGSVNALAFSPDGATLAIGSNHGSVALWETLTRKRRALLESKSGGATAVVFAPDSRRLAIATSKGEVSVWSWGEKVWTVRLPGTVSGVAWAPDGRHLATANANGTVYIFRVPD